MKLREPGIVSTNGAAEILKLTTERVRELERAGKIPSVRLPGSVRQRLFLIEDVEAFARERAMGKRTR